MAPRGVWVAKHPDRPSPAQRNAIALLDEVMRLEAAAFERSQEIEALRRFPLGIAVKEATAAHDAEVRREHGERIAQAIEDEAKRYRHPEEVDYGHGLRQGGRIAREASNG